MKRSLVAVVSCYALGLLLAGIFHPPPGALFIAAFLVLIPAILVGRLRPWLIWPLLALAGWVNLASRTAMVSPNDLRVLFGTDPAIVTVRGTLQETPRVKIFEHDDQPSERSLAQVRVTEIRRDEDWQAAAGKIMVATPGVPGKAFFAGQSVEIGGVIAPPPLPMEEGLFDYRDYLATRGMYYQLKAGSTNDWQVRPPGLAAPPLTDRFLDWSRRVLAIGLPAEDEPLRLLWAMSLGWRTAFTGDISEPFLKAGTMHLFAIDGLRIALLSGMIVTVLRVLRLSRAWCGAVAIPLIWFYTAATGWEASAIRASVMMTIVLGGWALKRPGDTVNSLAAAAFLLLLWDPAQMFEASFQLSFLVVLVIALMLPPLNRLVDRCLQHDPFLPDELVPRWRRALNVPSRWFGRYCALSLAAWAGSIPLAAKYFHLFSPVSTPANIVAVPLGTLALMSNLAALACGTWLPWLTELFNHSAWFFMVAMTHVSEWSANLPGAFFYVAEPSWRDIGIYYGLLIGVASGWLFAPRRRVWSTLGLVVLAAFYGWRWERIWNDTQLTVLPLSGGHAVWVDAPGRRNDWLIDCGNENAVNFTLKDFLHAQGVNRIPRLMLTEGEVKTCGGAVTLGQLFGVGELWTSRAKFRSAVYRRTVAEFEQAPSRHKVLERGEAVGAWRVLHPGATNNFPRADDNGLVLMGYFRGMRVLLLSDLGRSGQDELLSQTNDLRAEVVVAGLPDVGEPLCNALIDAVRPKVIVIADSEFPAARRAGRTLKERLAQTGVPVIYTRAAGAVTIVVNKAGWNIRTMEEE